MVIFEGTKGVGKTTLIEKLGVDSEAVYHCTAEDENTIEFYESVMKDYEVLDRGWLGELIWPKLYGRDEKFGLDEAVERFQRDKCLMIVLYASNVEVLIERVGIRDGSVDARCLRQANEMFQVYASALIEQGFNIITLDICNCDYSKRIAHLLKEGCGYEID